MTTAQNDTTTTVECNHGTWDAAQRACACDKGWVTDVEQDILSGVTVWCSLPYLGSPDTGGGGGGTTPGLPSPPTTPGRPRIDADSLRSEPVSVTTIVGVVVGGGVAMLLLGCALYFFCCRQRHSRRRGRRGSDGVGDHSPVAADVDDHAAAAAAAAYTHGVSLCRTRGSGDGVMHDEHSKAVTWSNSISSNSSSGSGSGGGNSVESSMRHGMHTLPLRGPVGRATAAAAVAAYAAPRTAAHMQQSQPHTTFVHVGGLSRVPPTTMSTLPFGADDETDGRGYYRRGGYGVDAYGYAAAGPGMLACPSSRYGDAAYHDRPASGTAAPASVFVMPAYNNNGNNGGSYDGWRAVGNTPYSAAPPTRRGAVTTLLLTDNNNDGHAHDRRHHAMPYGGSEASALTHARALPSPPPSAAAAVARRDAAAPVMMRVAGEQGGATVGGYARDAHHRTVANDDDDIDSDGGDDDDDDGRNGKRVRLVRRATEDAAAKSIVTSVSTLHTQHVG